MAYYTFEIFKYKWVTDKDGDTYRDYIDEMPHFIVEAENYIEATFKAQKKYPSDKYTHMLIDTDVEKWPADISMF